MMSSRRSISLKMSPSRRALCTVAVAGAAVLIDAAPGPAAVDMAASTDSCFVKMPRPGPSLIALFTESLHGVER